MGSRVSLALGPGHGPVVLPGDGAEESASPCAWRPAARCAQHGEGVWPRKRLRRWLTAASPASVPQRKRAARDERPIEQDLMALIATTMRATAVSRSKPFFLPFSLLSLGFLADKPHIPQPNDAPLAAAQPTEDSQATSVGEVRKQASKQQQPADPCFFCFLFSVFSPLPFFDSATGAGRGGGPCG
jgi:hypothetical protein